MLGAAMQAPLAGLALIMELTHGGFAIMIPLILATVTATVVARHIDGYSIYSARLRAHPLPGTSRPLPCSAARDPGRPRHPNSVPPTPIVNAGGLAW